MYNLPESPRRVIGKQLADDLGLKVQYKNGDLRKRFPYVSFSNVVDAKAFVDILIERGVFEVAGFGRATWKTKETWLVWL